MMRFRLMAACAVPALTVALAAPASAQSAANDDPTAIAQAAVDQDTADAPQRAPVIQDGDIVVTAQGRAQVLADVPLAISAVSGEALELTGANDIRQLNQVAPSLLVSNTGSEANSSARIRGVGTVGDNPGLESSVATFIDGVYRSRTGVGLNELGEIERIEVLRGPQGTLFGRNASAGLLNIVTKGPEFDFGGTAEITYGNYDYWRLGASVTGPVADSLALRLDGIYVQRDGFFEDVNTGYQVNDRDRYLLRAQALYEPTVDLSVRVIGDYSRREEACCAAVYATPEIAPANRGLIDPSNPIIPVLIGVGDTTFDGYFPAFGDPYSRRIAVSPNRSYDGETEDYGGSVQVDWNLGGVDLTSITAYRGYTNYQAADADYGLADILFFGPDSGREFRTFSQELRFQGTAFDGVLDWLVGGYYANEDLETRSELQFGNDYGAFASCRLLASISPALPRNPDQAGCLAGPGGAITAGALAGIFPDIPGPTVGAAPFVEALRLLSTVNGVGDDTANFNQNSENFAFFTHNIIHLTDRLDLTLGLRYTNETKRMDANFNNTNTICPQMQALLLPYLTGGASTTVPTSLTGGAISLACQGNSTAELNGLTLEDERNEDKITGTAVLSYKPTDDLLVYASYSRGYKAGGFNLDRSALKSPILPFSLAGGASLVSNLQFDEETVDAYEIGAKYSTGPFSLNLAAFRQEFSNFQLNTFNGTVYLVQNINGCGSNLGTGGTCDPDDITPGVISQGVELEATLVPIRDVRFSLGATYADTRYADRLVGSDEGDPLDPALALLPGDNLSNAPEIVVTSSFAYTPELGNSGLSGLFYIDARLADDYNTGSDLVPQKEQDSFAVVNGRIGVRADNWSLEVWGQNLFDVGYTQVGFSSPFQAPAQIYSAYLAEPRTYGITLRGNF
ncbi:TonB-dependent receptor [Sphingosinithalassobacter sp. CS137]|uniref:TonB-dependent receptor n=1 Tax=Sphingosinithalassobacter sp. CS137 TaxID=2762748 RepID=UPI0021CFCAB1|nr:TonB-dependent receptor [Sphingosinithalassobacter sp. CS137]